MPALSRKDRRALLIGVGLLLVFAAVHFVLLPLLEERKRLERGIAVKEKALAEMQAMRAEIAQFSRRSSGLAGRVAARSARFNLFAFLEEQAAGAQVKESILSMKPSDDKGEGELLQTAVEMKLQAVPLAKLVAFLERIESPENVVAVERIAITVNKKAQDTLDAVIRVVSLMQAKGEGG
jgi:general secretion pathway protein M